MIKEPEIWADVHGFYGLYEISSWGQVRNRKLNIIMKLSKDRKGYIIVGLRKQGEHFTKKVHRLVGFAFIPNNENKPMINHIDNNPANNYYKNLEWCTDSENQQHSIKQGRKYYGKIKKYER